MNICDAHNDFLTELPVDEIENYARENRDIQICASYWSTRKKLEEIEEDLFARANALARADCAHLLHLEDLWWIKDENALARMLELKPFSCSLTWNYKNCLASGSKARGGLSAWGAICVKRLLEAGVIIDTAHLNRQSFFDVAKLVKKNLYCSHTGFYGVRHHARNLTDRQVDFIVQSCGFVGLFFYDNCLKQKNSKPFSMDDIALSIDYFTSRWGYDNIGFGTDFYGIENYPQGLENYKNFKKLRKLLKEKGYSEPITDKLFYKNFILFNRRTHEN